jgi:hypothetical protein
MVMPVIASVTMTVNPPEDDVNDADSGALVVGHVSVSVRLVPDVDHVYELLVCGEPADSAALFTVVAVNTNVAATVAVSPVHIAAELTYTVADDN